MHVTHAIMHMFRMESLARQRAHRLDSLRAQIAKAKGDWKTDKRVNKRTLSFLNKQKEHMDQVGLSSSVLMLV